MSCPFRSRLSAWLLGSMVVFGLCHGGAVASHPFVPGSGERITKVGDDFEDVDWKFIYNHPKSSRQIDKQVRFPSGSSVNKRWYEGLKRGCPDVIRRVGTPAGGILGSQGALLIQTLRSGVPGTYSGEMEQDDLIVNVRNRMNGFIPVSWSPSIVVRVFLPEYEEWEHRTGIHFGFRGDVEAFVTKKGEGFFGRTEQKWDEYWPGIFVYFHSKHDGAKRNSAQFLLRAGPRGYDFTGPTITQTGWWTLGLSFTSDGQVHYYIRPGVEDLTEDDYVTSRFPYSYKCERLNNFFFNVANRCDGRTWSTAWIIDDPSLYFIRDQRMVKYHAPIKRRWVTPTGRHQQIAESTRQAPRRRPDDEPDHEPVREPDRAPRGTNTVGGEATASKPLVAPLEPAQPKSPGMTVSGHDDGPRFVR